jgi:Tfp pilus assembly protein PilE
MRALIVVTCVTVIAAVGYYAWGEYSDFRAAAKAATAENAARAELFEAAQAAPGETQKVRDFCKVADTMYDDGKGSEGMQILIRNCRFFNYLN